MISTREPRRAAALVRSGLQQVLRRILVTGEQEGDPDQRAGAGRGEPRDSRRALSSTTGLPPSPLKDARRAAEGFRRCAITAEIAAEKEGLHRVPERQPAQTPAR